MGVKKGRYRLIGRTKGGMNTICDSQVRPLNLFVIAELMRWIPPPTVSFMP
jgi:hypothetical protein